VLARGEVICKDEEIWEGHRAHFIVIIRGSLAFTGKVSRLRRGGASMTRKKKHSNEGEPPSKKKPLREPGEIPAQPLKRRGGKGIMGEPSKM